MGTSESGEHTHNTKAEPRTLQFLSCVGSVRSKDGLTPSHSVAI